MSTADLTAVPQTAPDVSSIELDGETVLYDALSRRLIVLNHTASHLWSCCDGAATVEVIIVGMADAYGVARVTIEADVLDVLGRFVAEGLVVRGGDG